MVESPCRNHCQLNDEQLCTGCYRHIDEIVAWGSLSDADKACVLARIRRRKAERPEH
ncbi:DUF1289 domain-containing protein [Larsenimonas suaedae]|uniref:DUF1289 domain-containing protein n=1 Tax=Larsenimonas suaedae TaxID=1851019 RepID=A0ABU1GSG9_9GAMM|nr:DUF1289 domain-containing protein [Larsenimonas suaedae]MCM2972245.1 DUF1289 domain-containing protein [Larsenimonas suaedae]MDR5894959.1 DUF1289 domain-containing protein [Larsenimonas suaedae]